MIKMNVGRLKIAVSLTLALGFSFLLTKTLFYPDAPIIQPNALVRSLVLLKRTKDYVLTYLEVNQEQPSAWILKPILSYPTPQDYKMLPPDKSRSRLVYPTNEPYPTLNPDRRITPIFRPPAIVPTIIPTHPSVPPTSVQALDLLALINQQRQKEGVRSLIFNSSLNQAAQKHAETTTKCSHYGPEGSSPFDRVAEAGYPTAFIGENIACGAHTALDAFAGWMKSSGHRANMVNKHWRSAGVGVAKGYWVFIGGSY